MQLVVRATYMGPMTVFFSGKTITTGLCHSTCFHVARSSKSTPHMTITPHQSIHPRASARTHARTLGDPDQGFWVVPGKGVDIPPVVDGGGGHHNVLHLAGDGCHQLHGLDSGGDWRVDLSGMDCVRGDGSEVGCLSMHASSRRRGTVCSARAPIRIKP